MKTYNTSPYFDDFDQSKNFYQIMFRPGTAVQARELTQLQTILRDQIEKFGNHIFRHGSVVIPGNSFVDLATPYIKLQANYGGVPIIASNFEGKVIVGVTSGIRAFVQKAVAADGTDPVTLYLSYLSGSATGDITFRNNEEIYVETNTAVRALTQVSDSTGTGSLAYVNQGVYYINGSFVFVEKQSTVIDKYSSNPSCKILLKITEQLVTSDDDETLLDPAQGSYNYAAPGAHRVQITLELISLPLDTALTDDYIELMRYNNGLLEDRARTPQYSELEKVIARRTFDESGNYVVNGLTVNVRESLKVGNNGGLSLDGDIAKLAVEINPGKAYVEGFEVATYSKKVIEIDKARTNDHIKNDNIVLRPEYGQYILVTNVTGIFSILERETIDFYNDNDHTNVSASKIGSAKVVAMDYFIGDPNDEAIYKLYITDSTLEPGFSLDQAGGIRYGSEGRATVITSYRAPVTIGEFTKGEIVTHLSSGRTATVHYWDALQGFLYVYKHDHTELTPRVGDSIISDATSPTESTILNKNIIFSEGQTSLLFSLPKQTPFSLRNPVTNTYDLRYTVQKELTIVTNTSGNGSVTISSGTIAQPELGTFIAVSNGGILQNSLFSINTAGTTLSITGGPTSATIKVYASVVKDGVSPKTKTVTTNSETIKYWVESTSFSLGERVWYGANLYEVTSSGTSGTVAPSHTTGAEANGTLTLLYISPVINITLKKTDIIGLTSIIDTVGDITANFTFSNGQTDYTYERGSVILRQGRGLPSGNFTITYSYYQHSVNGDFFSIDSYDSIPNFLDQNVKYLSDNTGISYDLASSLDFRPSVDSDGTFIQADARTNDLIVTGTAFFSSLQYFVPRIDSVVIDSAKNISIIRGAPNETPSSPLIPVNKFELNRLLIPEYTKSYADVNNVRLNVERFSMADIQQIVDRIEQLEEFTTLTSLEVAVTTYDVIDAETGLSRFKTGYLTESFAEPFTIARTTSGDYKASFIDNNVTAQIEPLLCNLELLDSSSNYVNKNGYIMLPYTETPFASQPLSSRVTNINPFLVIRWDGVLSVQPPADDWVETRDLPTIFEQKTETNTVKNYIPCPPPPPRRRRSSGGGGGGGSSSPAPAATVELGVYRVTTSSGYSYTRVGSATSSGGRGSGTKIGSVTVAKGDPGSIKTAARRVGGVATIDAYQSSGLSGRYSGPNAMSKSSIPKSGNPQPSINLRGSTLTRGTNTSLLNRLNRR